MKQLLLTEIKPITGTCFKCGSKRYVIKHHISYNPEVLVDCCRSCHTKIHHRVRKEGMCSLSVQEARRLSHNSSVKRHQRTIKFDTTLESNILLREALYFFVNNGNVYYTSYFAGNHGKKLKVVDI